MLRIGIDTGGTFTDFVIVEDGEVRTLKIASTPSDPARAVLQGLARIVGDRGDFLVRHGSTVATNALLERKGAKTALITNQGFEDVLEIGRQNRPALYSLRSSRPKPLVPQDLRIGIKERTLHDGSPLVALENKSLDWLASKISQIKPESIAVCLLYSYLNPSSESRIAEALQELGIPLSLSHRVLPEFREYERTSATVINAYLTPIMNRYLLSLTSDPAMARGKLTVMQSNGGAISGEMARSEPIRTLLSGPAGGVVGAFEAAKQAGYERIITFDMGGTSTDVCLCDGGIATTNEAQIDWMPVPVQMIGVHTIGAGGGSIARVDSGGLLRVGPDSAGADPGPICYGRGEDITVTDAHVYLGQLDSDSFLGGEVPLEPARVAPALEKLAAKITGFSDEADPLTELAVGVLRIVNTQMESAIRLISLQKGYDTRDFVLVTFGGCGALHACRLARALMIPRVLVPPNPGLLSASGILDADIVKDTSRTVHLKSSAASTGKDLTTAFQELEAQTAQLLVQEGLERDAVDLRRSLDVRYPGQAYELNLPHGDDYIERFHRLHEQRYGYSNPNLDVEIVTLRVRGIGEVPRWTPPRHEIVSEYPNPDAIQGERPVTIDGTRALTKIYRRELLRAGNRVHGPAVIAEYSSTTVVPAGYAARVDEWLNLIIQPRR